LKKAKNANKEKKKSELLKLVAIKIHVAFFPRMLDKTVAKTKKEIPWTIPCLKKKESKR